MAEDIQFKHFIGEGPEALALIATAKEGRAKYADAVDVFQKNHGFENTWSYKKQGIEGPLFSQRLADDEAKARGLKYHGLIDKMHAYKPRLNTSAGKALAAAIKQTNSSFFSASTFLVSQTKMARTVFLGGRVGNSSAGYVEDAVLILVPCTPVGGHGVDNMPAPPAWLRPCKESEFLAAQGL